MEGPQPAKTAPTADDTPLQILRKLALLKGKRISSSNTPPAATRLGVASPRTLGARRPRPGSCRVPKLETSIKTMTMRWMSATDYHQPLPDAAAVLAKVQEGIQRQWWREPSWRSEGDVRRPLKVPLVGWSSLAGWCRFLRESDVRSETRRKKSGSPVGCRGVYRSAVARRRKLLKVINAVNRDQHQTTKRQGRHGDAVWKFQSVLYLGLKPSPPSLLSSSATRRRGDFWGCPANLQKNSGN